MSDIKQKERRCSKAVVMGGDGESESDD